MQFALRASDLGGTTGNYIVLTRTYADGRATDVVTIPREKWPPSGSFYIAAKEMGDRISTVVYDAGDNVISETRNESIVTYALSMLGKAIMRFGASAYAYFH